MNLYRPVKADPHDWFSAEQIAQSRRYNANNQRVAIANGALQTATLIVLIAGRVIERANTALRVDNWVLQTLIAVVLVNTVSTVAGFPIDLWRRRHEREWRFTDQSTASWAKDAAKRFMLGMVVLAVLMLMFFGVVRVTDAWWFYGWLAFYIFSIALSALYPIVIMPLFNRFTAIEDAPLVERIHRLSREAGIPVGTVYSMDASKQTKKDNAFFTGFGRAKRVVLYDNILKLSPREVDVILAHEIAHSRRRHILKSTLLAAVLTFAMFVGLKVASTSSVVLEWIGVDDFAEPAVLPFVVLTFGIVASVTDLVRSWFARAFERQADVDSLEFTRDAQTFLDTHMALATRNLAELEPSWWHRVRSSHPPAAQRLAHGAAWRAQRVVTVLFTDIESSTELLERIGDARWYEVRRDHDEIVRAKLREHRGTEVDSAGDGFLLVFEDAGEALLCAQDVQRDIAAYNDTHPDAPLQLRMGLHTGEVVRRENAVFGRDVHVAARVSAMAGGGQILVTSAVHDALSGVGRFAFGPGTEVELKGLTGMHRIHPVPSVE
jgi:STE24 endopeptidase